MAAEGDPEITDSEELKGMLNMSRPERPA